MSLASHTARRFGVIAAGVLAIVGATPALASRPTMSAAIARARPHAEIGAGHSSNGGGRGGPAHVATHEVPPSPPTTRSAPRRFEGCLLAQTDDGRRTPQSRTTAPVAITGRIRAVRVVADVQDRRASVPGALFHDAHAPPSPATEVAGLRS
jgi:hypothetical protein